MLIAGIADHIARALKWCMVRRSERWTNKEYLSYVWNHNALMLGCLAFEYIVDVLGEPHLNRPFFALMCLESTSTRRYIERMQRELIIHIWESCAACTFQVEKHFASTQAHKLCQSNNSICMHCSALNLFIMLLIC